MVMRTRLSVMLNVHCLSRYGFRPSSCFKNQSLLFVDRICSRHQATKRLNRPRVWEPIGLSL